MKAGEIVARGVGRRFRVRLHTPLTLKEAILRRRRSPMAEIWALRDVSFAIQAGESVGIVGRNGSGKTTLLRLVAGILKPTVGTLGVGGTVGCLLELGAGFQPELTGRENVYLNGALHGLKQSHVRQHLDEIVSFAELEPFVDLPVRTYSAGMYMRLGFAVAMHIDRDVVLLDEVFSVGDEAFQRKCFGKIFEFKQRGGTILFVSHAATAIERLCERAILLSAGAVEYDGPAFEALARYRRLLAEEESPAESAAGLREWGSGEARLSAIRLEGAAGEERRQFLSGEPFAVRVRIETERELPPPRLSLELREASGRLLGTVSRGLDELGWSSDATPRDVRFELDRLPLGEGRFYLALALSPADGRLVYHKVDRAAEFLVYPGADVRGAVALEGRWSAEVGGLRSTTRS